MGPIFVQTIRSVLLSSSTNVSPGTSISLWSRDTKPSWLRFFRVIALQMKRGYVGYSSFDEIRSNSLEASDTVSPTAPSQTNPQSCQGQYLLLSHASNEGKKRLARQKMISETSSNRDCGAAVISDSHAQRKAMFLKQYKQRRISVDEPPNQTRRDGSILAMGKTFGAYEGLDPYSGNQLTPMSRMRDLRRGSSCDMSGANPFYHRARRRSDDSMKKKLSLDNQLSTLYV